ncbi:MAG: transposase family protein [Gammaproteobacteria bacterium]|nr:transposase family protein [Gammaproteobacteria bacterium]
MFDQIKSRIEEQINIFCYEYGSQKIRNGWRPFPGAVLLGDSAYPIRDWLMPPIATPNVGGREMRYNRAHKSTRRLVECSYGIMKNCFPCLGKLRVKKPVYAAQIVKAVVTLHNLRLKNHPEQIPDEEDDNNVVLNDFGLENEAETEDEDGQSGEATERIKGLERQRQLIQSFPA